MGTVGDTTIGAKVSVDSSGLDQAQSKLDKLIQAAERAERPIKFGMGGMNGFAKLEEQLSSIREKMSMMGKGIGTGSFGELNNATAAFQNKLREATETAKQFEGALKSTKEGKAAWDAQKRAVNEYENAIKKANSALKSQEQLQQAQTRSAITAERERQAQQRTAINEQRLQQAQMRTANMSAMPMGSGGHRGGEGEDWRWRSKVKGSIAETAGMYSLGFLGANAIISAGEKIKEMFGSGYEYTKEQSGMRGTWETLVDGARGEGISAKAAGSMRGIVNAINNQSITYGRGLDLTNEAYQQMYHATENAGQTKHMVQSELRIADAMGMSDDDARHFITYGVGHALDRGKVTGGALNQMAQYAPAITGALTRALISSKTGQKMSDISDHEVEKEKNNLRNEIKKGHVNAKMLSEAVNYLGDVKFKNAAENAMHTLPGMTRAVENGIPRMMGAFETSFAKPLEKTMGGSFYKLSKWFTDGRAEQAASKFGSSLSSLAGDLLKAGTAIAPLAKAFGGGFGKGFGDVFKTIKSGIDSISKAGDGIQKHFGKGSVMNDLLNQFGKLAGATTAITGLGLVARHIPVIGSVVNKIFSKLPIIGKLFGANTTAGGKMMSAANTMMAAANKMNGGSGGAGGLGGGAIAGEKLTMGQKLANSKFGGAIDKMFLKGLDMAGSKNKVKSFIGKGLMSASTFLGKGGIKLAETTLGRIVGNTGKFLGRGMPGLNALFAGFDIASTIATTKRGSKDRRVGIGSAVGGGVGGILGGALGSLLGPIGTVAGGVAGSWLGGKAGGFVGKKWPDITKFFGKSRSAVTDFSKTLQNIPGLSMFGHQIDIVMHPIKNFKRAISDLKNPKQLFSDIAGSFKGVVHPIKTVNSAVKNFGKAFEAFGKKNPFKNFDFRKTLGKFGKWLTTPIKFPKLPSWLTKPIKFTNPFKGFKFPKLSLPKGFKISNPFKGWKMPKISWPKLPKFKNPFKGFKLPKMPGWLSSLGKWFTGADKAGSSTKKAGSAARGASKDVKSIGKSSDSVWSKMKTGASKAMGAVKKAFSGLSKGNSLGGLTKGVSSALSKAKMAASKGAKAISKAISNGMKSIGKVGKGNMFSGLTKGLTSALNKAKSAAAKGANGISKALKSALNKAGNVGKGAFNKLASSVRSGMSKATSAARSGANKITSAIKNGLNKVGSISTSSMSKLASSIRSGLGKTASAAKSSMSKLTSAVKSGMSQAADAMKSGANKISSAVKSGMEKAVSAMKSAFSKMVSSAQSATSRIASSFSKIGSAATAAASKVRSLQSAINGLKSKTIDIKVNMSGKGADKFAKGTEGTKGGPAWVNDGLGANFQEAFRLPNGQTGLFPKVKNLLVDLPRGTKIWNGAETNRLKQSGNFPHYANGTGGKRGVNVTIQNINVGGSATQQDANNIAKAVHEALQREFANAFDLA